MRHFIIVNGYLPFSELKTPITEPKTSKFRCYAIQISFTINGHMEDHDDGENCYKQEGTVMTTHVNLLTLSVLQLLAASLRTFSFY